jgi:hypothetical protein
VTAQGLRAVPAGLAAGSGDGMRLISFIAAICSRIFFVRVS